MSVRFNHSHFAERGCVTDQPQRVPIASRLTLANAPDKTTLLRLVSATQPRSGIICDRHFQSRLG